MLEILDFGFFFFFFFFFLGLSDLKFQLGDGGGGGDDVAPPTLVIFSLKFDFCRPFLYSFWISKSQFDFFPIFFDFD